MLPERKMPEGKVDITFFVPCLNEEQNIIPTLETITAAAKETNVSYEILIYDDNSTDGTVRQVLNYQNINHEIPIRLIRNTAINGMGRNYIASALSGTGKYHMMVCGDNVIPKEFLLRLLKKLGTAEIIIPNITEYDRRPLIRRLVSSLYTKIINLVSGNHISYYNGGAIQLRSNIIRLRSFSFGFGFQAEVITKLLMEGATYIEVSVPVIQKKYSVITSAFTLRNILSVVRSIWKIFVNRATTPKSNSPQ